MRVRFAFLGTQGRRAGMEGNGSKGARREEGKKAKGETGVWTLGRLRGYCWWYVNRASTRRKADLLGVFISFSN